MSVTVALVDDEQLALDRMSDMLSSCVDVDVVAAMLKSQEALERIPVLAPDILFLDIEMPELDGFDIVERLEQNRLCPAKVPLVVFVTAHPNFVPQDFDTGAVDFLSKPVRLSRLEATLARARQALTDQDAAKRLAELQQSLGMLRSRRPGVEADREHIWIYRHGDLVRLNLDEVTVIQVDAEYLRIFTGKTSYLHGESMDALEKYLDPRMFVRIHRRTIVRRSEILSIRRSLHGGAVAKLANGDEAPIGRRYANSAREALLGNRGSH